MALIKIKAIKAVYNDLLHIASIALYDDDFYFYQSLIVYQNTLH